MSSAMTTVRPAGNAMTTERRALWLMLARDGGWWTVKALVHHWTPTFAEWELQELVTGLTPGGFLAEREVMPGQKSYCVTSDCVPLPGFAYAGNGEWKESA